MAESIIIIIIFISTVLTRIVLFILSISGKAKDKADDGNDVDGWKASLRILWPDPRTVGSTDRPVFVTQQMNFAASHGLGTKNNWLRSLLNICLTHTSFHLISSLSLCDVYEGASEWRTEGIVWVGVGEGGFELISVSENGSRDGVRERDFVYR